MFEEKIEAASARLKYIRRTLIEKKKDRLDVFKSILGEKTLSFLKENRSNLHACASKVAYTTKTNLREKNYDLNKRYIPDLNKKQLLFVNSKAAFLDDSTSRMKELYSDYLLGLKKDLSHQSEKVRILDPIETLKRGYSITYLDGNPLKKASQVKKGDVLKTILSEGEIKSRTE
jgi:exodeoxyribonuclease VII large subunit